MKKNIVYLIHFDKKYKHARHYIGFSTNLKARIEKHKNGTGARLLQVINAAAISWQVCRTWDGSREKEKILKSWKKSSQLCPICKVEKKNKDGG